MSRLVSTADAVQDYTEVELVYCRGCFNIRQQRRRELQDLTTATTLDAGVIASLLDETFRGVFAKMVGWQSMSTADADPDNTEIKLVYCRDRAVSNNSDAARDIN